MHFVPYLLFLVTAIEATYIKKWTLGGCGNSIYTRCNRLPAGRCCTQNSPPYNRGSLAIRNLPHDYDIAVPYNSELPPPNDRRYCGSVRLRNVQFGDLMCLSGNFLGTGLWFPCGSRFFAQRCLNVHSHPRKRDGDEEFWNSNLTALGEDHPGYIDEEEAALPEFSYHDAYDNLITEEEWLRLAQQEVEHEVNGTLHIMYPDLYPVPAGEKSPRDEMKKKKIDLKVYVNQGCHGEILADVTKKHHCYNTVNGAGLELNSLPEKCAAAVYSDLNCQGSAQLDIDNGAQPGCFDSIKFSSVLVTC